MLVQRTNLQGNHKKPEKGEGGIFWMIIYTKIIGLLRSSLFKRVTFQELCKTVLELNKVNRKLPGIVM